MKNIISILLFSSVAIVLCAVMPNAIASSGRSIMDAKVVNIQLDKDSAIKIAETILCHIYGEKVLSQKPWNIAETNESYIIKGQLPPKTLGGVAVIEISKKTGQVLHYSHSK